MSGRGTIGPADPADSAELIELRWSPPTNETTSHVTHSGHRAVIAAFLGVVVLVGLLLAIIGSGDDPGAEEPGTSPLTTPQRLGSEDSTALGPTGAIEGSTGTSVGKSWPGVPADHDPHVVGRPGSGETVLGEVSNLTLVYVNTIGRPTIVNLDTGTVRELDVATTRRYDRFYVEKGEVVAANPERTNLEPAAGRAIVFHVHQPSAEDDVTTGGGPTAIGPHLCLDEGGCPNLDWVETHLQLGSDFVATLGALADPRLDAFDLSRWEADGRFVEASVGTTDLRLPAPRNPTRIWVVHQPDGPKARFSSTDAG